MLVFAYLVMIHKCYLKNIMFCLHKILNYIVDLVTDGGVVRAGVLVI